MKNKKKLLYFVEAMGGGVFTYITNLANNLSDEFDIYIAYGVRPQTPKNFKSFFNDNIHLIEVKNFKRKISISDIKAFYEMRRIKKQINPDLIHLHSSKAGILGRWAFNGSKIPIFYTPHGYSFLMSDINIKKRFIFKLIEKISSLRNSITIACSYGEKLEAEKLSSKVLYVNNGINIDEISNTVKNIKKNKNDRYTIYTIGRISEQKNPYLFNKIAESFPNIKFVWIGDGELRKVLISPNIKITGWLKNKEVLKRAINYDVFLLTSKWEGLPMALLESMYIKNLCVVSDVIGNNNVIANGKNGFLCRNLSDYLRIINLLYKEKINNAKIIQDAYQDVITNYNSKVMAKNYLKIYNASLKKTN